MYQRILAALDGSPAAAHAAAEAIRIAAVDEQAEQGRALLAEAEAQARQAGIEPDVMLRSSDGRRTGEVVVAEATRWAAELIVLGPHGHGFMEKLLGSTTEEVLRSAPVPILLVPRATPPSR